MPSQGGAAPGRQQGGGGTGRKRQVLLSCAVQAECWRETALLPRGGHVGPPPLEEEFRPHQQGGDVTYNPEANMG